jgi:hypothetical protein
MEELANVQWTGCFRPSLEFRGHAKTYSYFVENMSRLEIILTFALQTSEI